MSCLIWVDNVGHFVYNATSSVTAVFPFSYALAQLQPLLKRVPSRSTSNPLELPLLLLEAEELTFLTAPLDDLCEAEEAEEETVPGAETLLPPLVDRDVEDDDGERSGDDGATSELFTGFKLLARLLLPHPLPLFSDCLVGSSSAMNGRGEGGGVNLLSSENLASCSSSKLFKACNRDMICLWNLLSS